MNDAKAGRRAVTYDELHSVIVERFPLLSKCLQQIASYALDNPSEMALETIAIVAPRAGVQPSSLIRFAKAFGFSGYSEMQRVFRSRLTDAIPDYKERLRLLRRNGVGERLKNTEALLEEFVHADIAGLQCLLEHRRIGALLDQAIKLIISSETVYLVAHRRSFPVACYLSYAMSQMNVRNILVDGIGGMFFQQTGHATPRDVMIAISTKTYSPDVAQAVRDSSHRGVSVIAITDGPLSPLVEHAAVTFEVQQGSVQMFRSLAAPMTLAVTLIVVLGQALEARRALKTPATTVRDGRA
jgi:DNA-binding MurR/RpiR family transcriptional regulator